MHPRLIPLDEMGKANKIIKSMQATLSSCSVGRKCFVAAKNNKAVGQ